MIGRASAALSSKIGSNTGPVVNNMSDLDEKFHSIVRAIQEPPFPCSTCYC
jgi:hypothetical protein